MGSAKIVMEAGTVGSLQQVLARSPSIVNLPDAKATPHKNNCNFELMKRCLISDH